MEGDVFLVGSQFMTRVTIPTSHRFVPSHTNWWSPPWAVDSSPEVNSSCVWGECCHPRWVLYCCERALPISSGSDFKATQGLFTQHCTAFTESRRDMPRGWLRSWAGLPKARLFPAFLRFQTALPRRAEKAPHSPHAGIPWGSLSLGGGSSARAESCASANCKWASEFFNLVL